MEIKATDLRIGNWIKDHTGLNNVVKMIGVGWVKFIDDEACAFDLCSGIPLTEELLLKIGFEKCNDMDSWYSINLLNEWSKLLINTKYYMAQLSINRHDTPVGKRIFKDFHQLQNLYHALTGQELTLS
jgi:hypothetical protein